MPRLVVDTAKESAIVYHVLESTLATFKNTRLAKEQTDRDLGKPVHKSLEMPPLDDLVKALHEVALAW